LENETKSEGEDDEEKKEPDIQRALLEE